MLCRQLMKLRPGRIDDEALGRALPCLRVFLLICSLLITVFPASDTLAKSRSDNALIQSASEKDYPPYCIVNDRQEPDGFSVELLRAALKAMGHNVAFRTGPWNEVKQLLADGKVEVLPLVGRTPEREAVFDFTFPYLTMHGAIVVRETEAHIKSLGDLRGKAVAVMRGDNAEEFVRRSGLGATVVTTATFEQALRELSDGQHDAVVVQKLVALQILQNAKINGLKVVGPPLNDFSQTFCFAVREGNHELLALLNEGLSIVIADGTFRKLHAKWFGPIENAGRKRSRIVVGGDSDYPPYEFLDMNGQPAGYNVELTRAVARRMGLQVDIRLGPWSEVRQHLADGKIDLVQGMFYSPERDQTFDFSPPHTVIAHVIVGRKREPIPANLEELAGKTVVVMDGDIMHDLALNIPGSGKVVTAPSQEEALRQLAAGQHDYALVARIPALYWIKIHGWDNLRVGDQSVSSPEYCYAAMHGDDSLLTQFSEGLAGLKDSGEYRKIHAHWLGVYEPDSKINLKWVLGIAGLSVLVVVAVVIWNGTLRQKVRARTAALKKEVEERRRSEQHYRALVNTIPHGITVLDREHRILDINDAHARMYGRPREWFIGRHCYELFEKRTDVCPHCPGVKSMQANLVAHTETEGVHDNGTRFSVILHTAPFQLDDGSTGFIEVVEDITEKKQLEAKSRQSAKMAALGRMATGVAHEINNPITGMINCAQLVKDRLEPGHATQAILDRIIRDGDRVAAIVRSLLSICHPGELPFEEKTVAECLTSVLNLCRSSLEKDGITLEFDLPGSLPPVKMQRQMMEQLFLNLINNAHYALNARFNEAHPEKRLVLKGKLGRGSQGDVIEIEVYDQGTGIEKPVLGKVFDPFFTTKPAGVGTGLGLAMCYEIVKRHGGEMRIESEYGQFTKVIVELPAATKTSGDQG